MESKTDENGNSSAPRRKLVVARETLRRLGAKSLRDAVGGGWPTMLYPECEEGETGWAATCPTYDPNECFTQDVNCAYTDPGTAGCGTTFVDGSGCPSAGNTCECTIDCTRPEVCFK